MTVFKVKDVPTFLNAFTLYWLVLDFVKYQLDLIKLQKTDQTGVKSQIPCCYK